MAPETPADVRAGQRSSASASARRVLGLPEPVERSAVGAAVHRTLERLGGPVGLTAATAPTIAFVVADATGGLGAAVAALAVTAVLACSLRLARRESPGAAIAGLLVAGTCAGVAALVGEARAFFLPTMVLPVLFVVAYVLSIALGRPLMGLVVNRLAGGPRQWHGERPLRRLYLLSTVVGAAMAVVNFLTRVVFYVADQPAVLAAVQVVASTAFALHFAVTLVVARRVAGRSRAPGSAATARP